MIFRHTKRLLPGAAIFSPHTLASPSARNMNYDAKLLSEKNIFEFFLLSVQVFCKYVSYCFPITIFCNPGAHYETPCICKAIPQNTRTVVNTEA